MQEEEETTKYAKSAKTEPKLLFKDESYEIIGACFEVYKEKGNGFWRLFIRSVWFWNSWSEAFPLSRNRALDLVIRGDV